MGEIGVLPLIYEINYLIICIFYLIISKISFFFLNFASKFIYK